MPPKKSKNEVVEVESCPICAEAYTSTLRKKVECNGCHKDCCIRCVERYMLSSIEDPHCMNCRQAWTRGFLNIICSSTFLNKTYYAFRQTVLVNREKSFLPGYQLAAEKELRVRELKGQEALIAVEYGAVELKMLKMLGEIQGRRNKLIRQIYNVQMGRPENGEAGTAGTAGATGTTDAATTTVAKFVRRCTANDCNGFLSSVWKCGICHVWVCPDCFEVKGLDKDTPHTCTADMLATAALIRKDTKPCPSCGEMISKIDGCDQMFCTSCHCPFSWITGKAITTGTIHNPHYFQWLAKGGQHQPQHPGFIPCGGFPNGYHVQTAFRDVPKEERKELLQILRVCLHLNDIERHRYERHLNPLNNEDVGVKFLLKETDEDGWKATLGRREKERQKSNEIRDILDGFNGAAIDLFRRIDTGKVYVRDEGLALTLSLRTELEALRAFTFEALSDVSRNFNCSVPFIADSWEIGHGKITDVLRKARQAKEAKEEKEAKEAMKALEAATTAATTDAF